MFDPAAIVIIVAGALAVLTMGVSVGVCIGLHVKIGGEQYPERPSTGAIMPDC